MNRLRNPRPWLRWQRYFYLRLKRNRSCPRKVARGLAAGVFVGMFPLFGLQSLLALGLASLVKGDKIVALLGTWISNPLTDVPIFWFNFQVGRWVLHRSGMAFAQPSSWAELWAMGYDLLLLLFTGCTIVASLSAMGGYLLGFWLSQKMRRWQRP